MAAKRRDPDYVSGEPGRYEISPWITHPAKCVCEICPRHRKTEVARRIARAESDGLNATRRAIEAEVWSEPLEIRARRASIYRDDRERSAAYAARVKREEEDRLAKLLILAEERRIAIAGAIPFGEVAEAYRIHLREAGKRYDRAKSIIDNLEAFFGRRRDVASIDFIAYRELISEVSEMSAETRRHYASMLLAILNHAKAERIITGHQLDGVRRPVVTKTEAPVIWTHRELAVLQGPAMDEFERAQGAWNDLVGAVEDTGSIRTESYLPLRGLCLIALFTLVRPVNNLRLTWEEIPDPKCRRFKLLRHKNERKGVKADGPIGEPCAAYLRAIRPAGAHGLIHPNPATGRPYVDIRKQWDRLVTIASRLLGYELTGRKADFFTHRHTGASMLAAKTSRPSLVVKMMGDTSLATVQKHYFNHDMEEMQEMIVGWELPQLETVAEGDDEWTM